MSSTYPFGQGVVKLISTDWLYEHMKDKDLMILDVQPNIHDYIQEHIPGAIYLNEGLLRNYVGDQPARWVLPDVIQPVLREAGLRADVPLVVYTGLGAYKGWGDGLEQTMMAYSLARYGHKNILVLNGGLNKWKAEERPLSKECPRVQTSEFTVVVQRDFYVDYDEFVAMKDREDVIVLDARPPDVYEGQGPWRKPGHIPGAVNLPWASLMDDKNKAWLKPDHEIRKILDAHGVTPDRTIITSCGTGREATNEFMLFNFYLGYPRVKNHEGAFTEWVSHPENSTVTGKTPF
ncbi:MAG: sulfurtransferase [Syntrophales bacterium]|jgi:thiosulfate/3-mercaptopyruvate sulfurtransferase|nr:sulfurtransferase [Syntrophales bacterium]